MGKLKTTGLGLILIGLSALGIGYLASILPEFNPPEDPAEFPNVARVVPQGDEARTAPNTAGKLPYVGEAYLEPLDISGRATGPAGQPVAGATVYVIDWRDRRPGAAVGRSRLLTTVTTGPDGRFIARGVKLGTSEYDTKKVGIFQIAATAPGFGLTWHEAIRLNLDEPRPPQAAKIHAAGFIDLYRGEPIQADLAFDRPATVRGRLVDDLGRPLAGVKVQVGVCDDIRHFFRGDDGKIWLCDRLDPTGKVPAEGRDLKFIDSLPESLLSTRTQPNGTYRIDGLPRQALFFSAINPGPDYEPVTPTIATTTRSIPGVLSLGHDAVLDHTFLVPRVVRLTVRYSDTQRPARNATVRARSDRTLLRAGSVGTTDDNGRTTLRLRPGEYELALEPPLDAPYRPGRKPLKIGPEDAAEINDLKLEPAALVTLEAVDAKTGAGVAGVRFQYETDTSHKRRGLSSQLVVVDHPATDERGRLRAVVEPGRRQFFVETIPPGWRFEGTSGESLELAAGREITVRFAFVKVEEPVMNPSAEKDSSLFPEDLVEKWRGQQLAARTGKFRIRQYSIGRVGSISQAELDAFLEQGNLGEAANLASLIRTRFPGATAPEIISEIVVDVERKRHTESYQGARYVTTSINNGTDNMGYSGNAEYGSGTVNADIFKNGPTYIGGLLGAGNFTYRPPIDHQPARSGAGPAGDSGIRRTEGPDGRLTIENETPYATARWIVDRTTGFVHAYSSRSQRQNGSMVFGEEVRQYGPKVFANGAVLPTVHVEARISGDRVNSLVVKIIDEADLAYRPGPLDFALAVPAGTVIVDRRESRPFPNRGTAHYPVADVIAFADEMASRYHSIEPVLKIGQPAPPIQPAAWFGQNGPAQAPELADKIVLLDFWGNTCAPCMTELPEVQAAADRFAARREDFVLIGLHNSGPTADVGAAFARKQGLTYRLAIDRPVDEEGWPGATFQSYGIRPLAFPAAVVIDRQGKIAFVGQFRDALQKATDLLAQ